MRLLNRQLKGVLVAAIATTALLAGGVASATAAPATWSTTGQVKQTGNLTLTLNGGSAKTCAVNLTGTATNSGGAGLWYTGLVNSAPCVGGGSVVWTSTLFERPSSDGAGNYAVELSGGGPVSGPWSGTTWRHTATQLPFVNGGPGVSSRIVLDDVQIGYDQATYQPVRASGTLTVTTPAGGLVTLN